MDLFTRLFTFALVLPIFMSDMREDFKLKCKKCNGKGYIEVEYNYEK